MTRAGEPSHCIEFRCLLEEALSGRADPPRLTELGWHEHLLGCGDCRGLLEAEEALELLLASLPDPKLPPDLRRRVLLRLRAGRQEPLESLLDLDHVEVPGGLARATTDALRERLVTGIDPLEAQLDALLEAARPMEVPDGLSQRVLAGIEGERVAIARRSRFLALRGGGAVLRAAAAVLVGVSTFAIWTHFDRPDSFDRAVASVRDEDVIQSLAVLDYWDALQELDPVERDIVVQLDLTDVALFTEGVR